jgi:ABC-2 type transport system ATP-binding protein
MSISVKNVTKNYGTQKALDDVSFDISAGEVVGFLGPNGAGKSTMMKIICCYIPPSQGEISVCGYSAASKSIDVRRNVGYLPEHNPLYLDMYVREYLEFVGGIFKLKNLKDRVSDMINLVGLSVEQHKQIGELSKGYRQRVGLAQAMIHDPKVLILDEPTSGLDPNQLVEIRELIRTIGKEKTVMLSTHIMQEVEAICNRVIIINKGSIVADRPAGEIRASVSGSGYTLKVEFQEEVDVAEMQKVEGIDKIEHLSGHVYLIGVSGDTDIRQDVFNFAVKTGNSVLSSQKEEQSLEEVFKALTQG